MFLLAQKHRIQYQLLHDFFADFQKGITGILSKLPALSRKNRRCGLLRRFFNAFSTKCRRLPQGTVSNVLEYQMEWKQDGF